MFLQAVARFAFELLVDICYSTFSYPEPFLRAVRRGALAKSISNWHLIGYNEGYCSNNVYILLPCFYGIRFWIWPEPLVAPRVRRALGTRMVTVLIDNLDSSPVSDACFLHTVCILLASRVSTLTAYFYCMELMFY